jgi:ABC-2 type transport system ATP-binding protein
LLWAQVRALADDGAAVLLVTHNVLEAERCVDRLAIIDHGRVVAEGTPASLKAELNAPLRLELVLEPDAVALETSPFGAPTAVGRRRLIDVDTADASAAIEWASQLRDEHTVAEFMLGPASLEDLYVRRVRENDAPVLR